MSDVQVRRIYDEASDDDGHRVLIDRLWPRGVRKADAELDDHLTDVAPSSELRQWYGHDPDRFDEFRDRYRAELDAEPAASHLATLVGYARQGRLTLLTATKDVDHSHAAVLAERVRDELADEPSGS